MWPRQFKCPGTAAVLIIIANWNYCMSLSKMYALQKIQLIYMPKQI